jgi:hypothetical protein
MSQKSRRVNNRICTESARLGFGAIGKYVVQDHLRDKAREAIKALPFYSASDAERLLGRAVSKPRLRLRMVSPKA